MTIYRTLRLGPNRFGLELSEMCSPNQSWQPTLWNYDHQPHPEFWPSF